MGLSDIFAGFWKALMKILSLGKTSREDEEEEERDTAEKIAKDSKKEEVDEIIEDKLIKAIVKKLGKILKKAIKKPDVEIRRGQRVVTLVRALEVLIYHLKKLVNTGESATEEERDLGPIEHQWLVVREGLDEKDAKEVSSLFKRLNITLEDERRSSWQKIALVEKLRKEMQESEGAGRQQAPGKLAA